MNSREIALISVFAAIWITAQLTLGPLIGRFSLGPVSLHGVVNRVVGWMLIFAEISAGFGRVSIMALIASLGTRIIRLSPLTGLVTGAGYALGGFTFDVLFYSHNGKSLGEKSRKAYLIAASLISGAVAIVPYLILKFSVLSRGAFLSLIPVYTISTVKGIIFSVAGTLLGLSMINRVKDIT